jgi:hypothetical protein
MKKLVIILFPIFLALTSCDKLAKNIDAPKVEAELVVFSFLSPEDSIIKVEVSLSKPIFGKANSSNDVVTDANVTITNDAGFAATIAFQDSASAYLLPTSLYPIEAGRTYTIHVAAAQKTVYGTTTVPTTIIQPGVFTYQKRSNSGSMYYTYSYKWQDEPGTKNYYRSSLENSYSYVDFFGDTTFYHEEVGADVFTDENKDGLVLNGICDDYNSGFNVDSSYFTIDYYLLNTDIHYYEYHKRRLIYYGDDPFSEPLQQYSNINGGLGVVASYRQAKQTEKVYPQ